MNTLKQDFRNMRTVVLSTSWSWPYTKAEKQNWHHILKD